MEVFINGWVLLGGRSSNEIRSINAVSATEGDSFQLSASPGDLELDSVNGLLFVTQAILHKYIARSGFAILILHQHSVNLLTVDRCRFSLFLKEIDAMKVIYKIILIAGLLFASVGYAEKQNHPPLGSYGFDWLSPDKAQCQKVTPELLKKFHSCEYKNPGGFGLGNPSHKCRISTKSEYIVFPDKAKCIDELETMKANAP